MTDDLVDAELKHLQTFKSTTTALVNGDSNVVQQAIANWNTLSPILAEKVFPRVGPAVQLAARSMVALVASCLSALSTMAPLQGNAQAGPVAQPLRQIWVALITGQVSELENLLKQPLQISEAAKPTVEPTPSVNFAEIKGNLSAIEDRSGRIRVAGYAALAAGVVLAAAAACFALFCVPKGQGWPLAVEWGSRILVVVALVVPAIKLFDTHRDLMARAGEASREHTLLRALAAATYLRPTAAQAESIVELVRALAAAPLREAKAEDQPLVVPQGLVKEIPELIRVFKGAK